MIQIFFLSPEFPSYIQISLINLYSLLLSLDFLIYIRTPLNSPISYLLSNILLIYQFPPNISISS